MDQFKDFCHLQTDLEYVLFIEDMFSSADEIPQTIVLTVLIDYVLSILLVDDFLQLYDMLAPFVWRSQSKGPIDLHQYLMFSLLTDGISTLLVLVDVLLAPLYGPGLALYIIIP